MKTAINTFRRSVRPRASGVAMIDTLVALGISAVLMAVLAKMTAYSVRSFAAIDNYCQLEANSRNALDRLSLLIRQSDALTSYTTNELVLSCHSNVLRYAYSPTDKTLVQTYGTVRKTLLTGCDSLLFQIYQRNPVSGSYDQYPASLDTNTAKIVQVTWVCSRSLVGGLVNTEDIQSAKIVIRNQ